MKRASRIALAFILLPFVLPVVEAATQFIGNAVNVSQVNGANTATGAGASNSGTLRVVTSSDSSLSVSGSTVQVTGLNGGPVAISAASLPLPTGAATSANQSTELGYLLTISTTQGPNTTQPISAASLPLPTGASTSGNQTTELGYLLTISTNVGANITQSVSVVNPVNVTGSTVIVAGLNGGPLSVTSALTTSANVTKSSVTVASGGASTQLLPSQATRAGVECTALCTNTDYVYININSASAATVTDYPLGICSSWNPPAGMVPTGAIQVIAGTGSGNQVVRCVSYTP